MFDEFKPIDTDSHLTEPHDVWTSRVSSKWGDAVPHIKRANGMDMWMIRDKMVGAPGAYTLAGNDISLPDMIKTYEELPASSYVASERLKMMDKEGIYAQVLYPNVAGFGSQNFLQLKETELMLECVRAYNDFTHDWCSADPKRLLPAAAMPFWDVDAAVKEIERVAKKGHKTILACTKPLDFGLPHLANKHWDRYWGAIQDSGLPVSFHIGSGDLSDVLADRAELGFRAVFGNAGVGAIMGNMQSITDIIFGGVCDRFPTLKFFSVESGVGWLPSFLELCDWQWVNNDVIKEHPDWKLLPSEYFKRQIYGSFWFETERAGLENAIKVLPDNIMWETDYPHPTSQFPALKRGWQTKPRTYAEDRLQFLGETALRKVFHSTAARVFNLAA